MISQAADVLPPSQRGIFIEQVARRLSKCCQYHDHDVTRACRLARRTTRLRVKAARQQLRIVS
jgi:hypothetical protein